MNRTTLTVLLAALAATTLAQSADEWGLSYVIRRGEDAAQVAHKPLATLRRLFGSKSLNPTVGPVAGVRRDLPVVGGALAFRTAVAENAWLDLGLAATIANRERWKLGLFLGGGFRVP